MPIKSLRVENFNKGLENKIEDQSISRQAFSDGLNFAVRGDSYELRRGSKVIGNTVSGTGHVNGVRVVRLQDGTEVLFKSRGKKIEYYNTSTETWVECGGTDNLTTQEDISMESYQSLAGTSLYISSPNNTPRKIVMPNYTDVVSISNTAKNFPGWIKIKRYATYLWNRGGGTVRDTTQLYRSRLDKSTQGQFTLVSAEVLGTGDGVLTTFTGTLAFKGGGSRRTCFSIAVTAGSVTGQDDKNGNIVGTGITSGTINYATGAFSITFASPVANLTNITSDYYWTDDGDGGIMDFTFTSTRVAGEGYVLPQNNGGDLLNIFTYNFEDYCGHEYNFYKVTTASDDVTLTNLVYRQGQGIKNFRSGVETGDGIYYVDTGSSNDPAIRLITLGENGVNIIPVEISQKIDLTGYVFDREVGFQYGDLILFACRTSNSEKNNRVIVYNKLWKTFEIHDWSVSCFDIYQGALIAGEDISDNVVELYSGLDDDGSGISGFFETKLDNLDLDQNLKKVKKLQVQGLISPEQIADVFVATDRGAYVKVGQIRGDGDYVDRTQAVTIGSLTLGRGELGGGGDGLTAYNYQTEFDIRTDRMYQIRVKIATGADDTTGTIGIGYFSVSTLTYYDIRRKEAKAPIKYRITT